MINILMRKILLIIVLLLMATNVFAIGFSYKSLIKQESSTTTDNNSTLSSQQDLSVLIKVLKDPKQRDSLIKALETATKDKSKNILPEPQESNDKTINKIEKIDTYTRSFFQKTKDSIVDLRLYEYAFSNYYLLKDEVTEVYNNYIIEWLYWVIALFLSIFALLVIEKMFFWLERKSYDFYGYSLRNESNKKINYFYKRFFSFILVVLPTFLAASIVISTLILIYVIPFRFEFIKLFILFALLRIISIFILNIFYKIQNKSLLLLKRNINFTIYTFYTFLVVHSLLTRANSIILLKINFIIFIIFFGIVFFKLRKHIVNVIYHMFSAQDKQYVLLWRNLKHYYIILLVLIILSINYIRFILNYGGSVDFFVKFMVAAFQILILYLIQRILFYLFRRFIIRKIENDLYLLSTMQVELKDSYKILNMRPLWFYFEIIMKAIFIIIYIYVIDRIWNLQIIAGFKYILNFETVDILINIFIGLSVLLLVTLIILILIQYFLIRRSKLEGDLAVKKYLTLFTLCRTPYKIVCGVIMIIVVLSAIGLSITTLLASTGVITLVIAFGAKDVLQNLVNGMIFLMEDSFTLNDFISIDGNQGSVEDISMIYIKLRDIDGKLHMIPFKNINVITNYTKIFSYAFIEIGISYDSDVNKATTVLQNIYNEIASIPEYKEVILSPLIVNGVVALEDFAVKLRCKVQTIAGQHTKIKTLFLQKIKEEFKKNDIEIPFPYRTLIHKDGSIPQHIIKDSSQTNIPVEKESTKNNT
ncbi:mechanosensitive ion channel [Candidatus Hepatincola sp. Av]